jgi:ankyrin repeat protein
MKRNIMIIIGALFILLQSTALFASPLHDAAAKGDIKAAENWLNVAGKTINDSDQQGNTPLSYAVEFGTPEMVKFLLDKGANVNGKGTKGWAPIHFAMWSKNPKALESAKILIERGANINLKAVHHEFAPIFYAIMYSNKTMVQFCIDNGADLTIVMNNKMTPLQYAHKYCKSTEIIKLLEANGAK